VTLPLSVIEAAQAGDCDAAAKVLDACESYIANAASIMYNTHIDQEDLRQDVAVAVLEALHRFEPDRGWAFETFLYRTLRGAVMDAAGKYYQGSTIPSRTLSRYWSAVGATLTPLEARERAAEDGMAPLTFDAVHNMVTRTRPIDTLTGFGGASEDVMGDFEDSAEKTTSSPTMVVSKAVIDWTDPLVDRLDMVELLEALDPKERMIIEAAYLSLDPQSDGEIAQRLGLDRSTVGRTRRRALARLQVAIVEAES